MAQGGVASACASEGQVAWWEIISRQKLNFWGVGCWENMYLGEGKILIWMDLTLEMIKVTQWLQKSFSIYSYIV